MECSIRADHSSVPLCHHPGPLASKQPCVMQPSPVSIVMFVYCPWVGTTWKWVDQVCGHDPSDKNNPCPYNHCLSSSLAHTQVGPVLSPQDGSHGTALWRGAQHGRIRTNESGDSALCVSNDWQHVGLLTEALVMVNLLHALVPYSVCVIILSVSWVHGIGIVVVANLLIFEKLFLKMK